MYHFAKIPRKFPWRKHKGKNNFSSYGFRFYNLLRRRDTWKRVRKKYIRHPFHDESWIQLETPYRTLYTQAATTPISALTHFQFNIRLLDVFLRMYHFCEEQEEKKKKKRRIASEEKKGERKREIQRKSQVIMK